MAVSSSSAIVLTERLVAPSSKSRSSRVWLQSRHYDLIKRGIDFIAASVLLVALSPLMVVTALIIRITSRGPAIFKQERLTIGGRRFTLLKFRTMVNDAEQLTGAVWAANDDPRVTAVGKILRFARLDELPQLLNVIRGEMSLIGPRPERPEIAAELSKRFPHFNDRLQVRAGISGLAQTGAGYASCMRSYRKKLALDLIYIRNRCLFLDLRIAAKTVLVVLTGSGAR